MSGLRAALIALPCTALAVITPVSAQTLMAPGSGFRLQPVAPRPTDTQTQTADPAAGTLDPSVACPGKLQALKQNNAALRDEIRSLQDQLSAYTNKGGSRVTAYCESSTISRNTAGATNNCAQAGYGCEPVSGLCRTSAQYSDHCAPGFVMDASSNRCVPNPGSYR